MTQSKSKTVRKLARKRGIKFVEVPLSMGVLTPADFLGFPTVEGSDDVVAQHKLAREVGDYKLGDK